MLKGTDFYKLFFYMKKSLALKLEKSQKSVSKKKLTTRFNQPNNPLKNAKTSLRIEVSPHPRIPSETKIINIKQASYRSKNLSVLPASLLNTLSELKTLDISHNKLTDPQIELLMGSCPKLQCLSIQGNLTSIIPAAIWKLKYLLKFRHDWVKLFPEEQYENPQNLSNIKAIARKPNLIVKANNVLGINFEVYCRQILNMEMNSSLLDQVQACQCSHFAKNQMMEAIRLGMMGKKVENQKFIQVYDDKKRVPLVAGCFAICGFGPEDQIRPKQQLWKEMPMKKQLSRTRGNEENVQESEKNIKIQNIREISETEAGSQASTVLLIEGPEITYQHKNMPLHLIFSKFDTNKQGAIDVDRLLIKGYNPNTYDHNGLSAYHIIIIFRQEKGLERLIEISSKNPGFIDLEMPSLKEGRNILHFSVFLKDYSFTKKLIDFGYPLDKRDFSGARIIHLVDQNYQFLLLLRKAMKSKMKANNTSFCFLSYPQPMTRKYTRHPPRVTQQANYQTLENKNNNLLQMYDAAVGLRIKNNN